MPLIVVCVLSWNLQLERHTSDYLVIQINTDWDQYVEVD